jgi:hypothetical protein
MRKHPVTGLRRSLEKTVKSTTVAGFSAKFSETLESLFACSLT